MWTIVRLAIVVVVIGFVAYLSREAAAGFWGPEMELSWPRAIFLAPLHIVVLVVGSIAMKISPGLVTSILDVLFAHPVASSIGTIVAALACWGPVVGFVAGDSRG